MNTGEKATTTTNGARRTQKITCQLRLDKSILAAIEHESAECRLSVEQFLELLLTTVMSTNTTDEPSALSEEQARRIFPGGCVPPQQGLNAGQFLVENALDNDSSSKPTQQNMFTRE